MRSSTAASCPPDSSCRRRERAPRCHRDWGVTVRVHAWIPLVPGPTDRLLHHARVAKTLIDAGLIAPTRPDRLALAGRSLLRWGTTSAGAIAVTAARAPHQPAVIDELGTLSYSELHRRANALAS